MNIKPPPIDFRTVFTYDHGRGVLIRITTGKPAGVKYKTRVKKGSIGTYGVVKYKQRGYAVHRVVWAVVHGAWPETSLDHIDHDTRNNHIENLRLAPPAENARNLSKFKNNTTGKNGVVQTISGHFQARIGYKNRRISLGTYDTLEEAYAVYEAVRGALGFHPNHGT